MRGGLFSLFLLNEVAGAKLHESPVTRVVKLVEGLGKQIEKDAKSEEKSYSKYACYCTNMGKKKGEAIEQGKKDIAALHTTFLVLKAKVNTNKAKIKRLNEKIAESQDAIEKAETMFKKQTEQWKASHAETMETLNGLERAIKVLKKGSSLLQADAKNVLMQVADQVGSANLSVANEQVVEKYLVLMQAKYTPQSQTIQGILQEMYKTFSEQLQRGSSDWLTASENTQNLVRDQTEIIEKSTELLQAEEKSLSENSVKLAEAEEDFNAANKQLDHDNKFFQTMQKSCEEKKIVYDDRVAKREREAEGIRKALEILEENRDHFTKSFQKAQDAGAEVAAPAFVQVGMERKLQNVREVLRSWARKSKSPRLALLAASAQGPFNKVVEKINLMIQTLKSEETADDKQDQECKADRHDKNIAIDDRTHKKDVANRKADALEKEAEQLAGKISKSEQKIEAAQQRLSEAEQARNDAHDSYVAQKKDDNKSIELLDQVRTVLMEYYTEPEEQKTFDLIQEPEFEIHEETAPVAEFAPADSNSQQNKGAVGLIENILGGLQQKVRDADEDEISSLKEFKEMKAVTEQEIADENTAIEKYSARKLSAEEEMQAQIEHAEDMQGEIDQQKENWAEKKHDCDWIRDNIKKRRELRKAEVQGLTEARDLLQGAMA